MERNSFTLFLQEKTYRKRRKRTIPNGELPQKRAICKGRARFFFKSENELVIGEELIELGAERNELLLFPKRRHMIDVMPMLEAVGDRGLIFAIQGIALLGDVAAVFFVEAAIGDERAAILDLGQTF